MDFAQRHRELLVYDSDDHTKEASYHIAQAEQCHENSCLDLGVQGEGGRDYWAQEASFHATLALVHSNLAS